MVHLTKYSKTKTVLTKLVMTHFTDSVITKQIPPKAADKCAKSDVTETVNPDMSLRCSISKRGRGVNVTGYSAMIGAHMLCLQSGL